MIPLFYPYVSEEARKKTYDTLGGRWIGQGKKVERFERMFTQKFGRYAVATNSCTSALELAYHMMDFKLDDEVIVPVFTCTATTIPLARRGVNIVFADVKRDLMLDFDDVKRKITDRTRAVVNVHLYGFHNKAPRLPVPVIGDAAQYLGKTEGELFTAYSFQATKMLTTVDGGMLVCRRKEDYKRAKLLRWYGIDRDTVVDNIESDITEAGYKMHMNDVTAALGIAGLRELPRMQRHLVRLQVAYAVAIGGMGGSPYLIHVKNRDQVRAVLKKHGIESGLVHKRNDVYSVFGGRKLNLPTMNQVEKTYLFLPCNNHTTLDDVKKICRILKPYVKA